MGTTCIFIKNIRSHPGCLARNYIQKAKIISFLIYIYIYLKSMNITIDRNSI